MPEPRPGDARDETLTLPEVAQRSSRSPVRAVFAPEQVVAGRFRIARLIRQGGMGQVYEAEDLELGQRVALKTLRPELAADERLAARFKEEIGLARRVTHANACRAFDLFRHRGAAGDDVLFISMEYLPGRPLDQVLAEQGTLPARHALAVARQVAEGLEAAHRAGVLHRDLKPGNVLLVPCREGVRAVVTDFGLAQAVAESSPGDPPAGTPSHMAPEQLDGRGATARTDVYALGLLLFEMRTGRLPEPGELERPAGRRALGRRWAPVIRRCLARDPEERFATPRAVVDQLDPDRRRRPWRLVAWAAALAVVLTAAAAVYMDPGAENREIAASLVDAAALRPSAAVLEFASAGSEEPWLREALPQMLQAHLAGGDSIRLLPRRYLASLGIGPDEGSAALGRTLGIRWLVAGSYSFRETPQGPLLEVEVRLLDAEGDGTEESFTDARPVDELFSLVARIASRLRSRLRVEQLTPAELGLLQGSLPEDVDAFRLYSEGLLALDRRRPDRARALLERAVESAPGFPLARIVLADALDRLGYREEAKSQAGEAFRLAADRLPREEALLIEARYRAHSREWDEAIRVWDALRTVYPDNPIYAYELAFTQGTAGRPEDAVETLEELKTSGIVAASDPRLDLAEAKVRTVLGDFPGSLAAAAAAADKAEAEGLPGVRLEALHERAFVLRESGRLDEAEALYREALTVVEQWDHPALVAQFDYELGVLASYRSDFAEARRRYERALAVFRELGDVEGMSQALSSLGFTLAEIGDLAEADRRAGEAVEIDRRLGRDLVLASGLSNHAGILQERGEIERAQRLYEEAVSLIRGKGSGSGLAAALNNLGGTLLLRGDTSGARRAIEEAYELSEEAETDLGVAITLITLAAVDYDELELDAARERLEKARSLAEGAGLEWLLGHADEGLGRVAIETGDLEEARRRLEASLARRRALGEGREISSSLCALAELALAEGNPGETEGRARSCLAESRERGKGSEIPRAGALLAESLVGLGRVEEAERVADNTILSAADSAMIVSRVAAVRVRALLAAARGQRERAIQELESLLESDLAGGPPRIRREISRSLRSL